MCANMDLKSLLRFQWYACLVSPALQRTFIPWRRRWQPILPIRDLCWRSIIAVTASRSTIAMPATTLFASHSPTSRQSWPPSRSLRLYLWARLLVAYHDPKLARALRGISLERLPTLWDQFNALARIPLMVIRGANSDMLARSTLNEMLARRGQLEVVVVRDQGHAPLLAEPKVIRR